MTAELYPGQAEVVIGKLTELELLQAADEAELETVTDPARRAAILRTMAGRAGSIASQRRFADGLTEGRTENIRLRLKPSEAAALREAAAEGGETVAAYVRRRCDL